jgi:uncharacterized membrane protein
VNVLRAVPFVASLTEWLHMFHLLAAMVWVGGVVTLNALATQVLRTGDGEAIARFVRSVRVIGPLVLAPATLAVTGFGVWLVIDSDSWGFGQTWVWLALVLLGVAFLVGAVFQSQTMIRAQRATEAGEYGQASRHLSRWSWGMRLILLLLLIITWDMVFKPGF